MTIKFCPKCNNIICDCSPDDRPSLLEQTDCEEYDIAPAVTNLVSTDTVETLQKELDNPNRVNETLVIDSITSGEKVLSNIIEADTPELKEQYKTSITTKKDPKICEVCSAECSDEKGWFKHYAMYMCPTCRDKEMALSAKNKATEGDRVSTAIQDTVARSNQSIIDARESKVVDDIAKEIPVDGSIQVRTDIFNAKTISIIDMQKRINGDDSIEKKHFALALELRDRFLHLRKVLFDIDESRVSITNEQRSIQTYLNELSNKLRTEEREKIKLKDINYKPVVPKIAKPRLARKPKLPKFDKAELKRLASETGIPEFTLQTICVAKGIQPAEAAKMLTGLQK